MFEQAPKPVNHNEEILTWEFPDGTIGRGTAAEKKEALENWDNQ